MITDEWVIERWVRDFVRYTPLSETEARVVVGVRAEDKTFADLADELDVHGDVVVDAFDRACELSRENHKVMRLFIIPRHEWENLEEYPGAQREVEKYVG